VPADRPFVGDAAPVRGTFRVAAAFDQLHRTYAWRRLDDFPLVVNVGLGESPVLGPVEDSIADGRRRNGIGIAVVLLLAGGIAWLLVGVSARQRALAESGNRYRGFFETNTAIKLLIDPADGRIVDANPAAVEYYGYPRATLLTMRVGDINCLPPEQVKEEMARAKAEERLYFNFSHRLASGEIRQVEVYSGPLELGGRQLLFSIVHDITVRRELEQRLKESEELHRTLFKTMAEGVLVVGADGRIHTWNAAALAILGVDADGLLGRQARIVDAQGRLLAAEDFPSMRAAHGEELEHALFGIRREDDSVVWVTVSSRSLCREGESHPCAAVVSFSDITRLMEAEESLKLAQSVFDAAAEGIMVTDAENRILTVNPAFTEITGYGAAEVIGRDPKLLASGQHDKAFYQALWQRLLADGRWEGEVVNRRKNGAAYVEWLKISRIADAQGRPRRYVALFSDVTEKKRKEEVVWHQANFDTLTGLPNRQLLEDRLEQVIAQAHRRHFQVALLFIDLDRFKPVNDEFGHAVGDELLRQVGRRLQNSLREEDTVARLGGDEFVAVLPDLRSADAPAKTAEKIVSVLSEPYRVGERILEISCCVGVALFPRDADNAVALIERADMAMYAAKESGRSTWRQA
jgi:diguanylate cyclase (GGDEF)-like protein/PAS domain S-box-containing protein